MMERPRFNCHAFQKRSKNKNQKDMEWKIERERCDKKEAQKKEDEHSYKRERVKEKS